MAADENASGDARKARPGQSVLVYSREGWESPVARERLVSLIIPSYNHERYAARAVQSALDQQYSPLEIIIIDDGSRDRTAAVIEETLAAYSGDKRVRFFTHANQGLSRTLNTALRVAEGAYVQILASDDAYLPNKTSACLQAFDAGNEALGAVYCDGYLIDGSGHRFARFTEKYLPPVSGAAYENLLLGNWIPALGVLYRTDALLQVGGFDESLAVEDYDLLLRLARKFEVRRIPDKCFEYRWHGSNFSQDKARMEAQFAAIAAKHPDLASYRAFRQGIVTRSLSATAAQLSVLNVRLAMRMALRALQARFHLQASSPLDLLVNVGRKGTRMAAGLLRARLQSLTGLRFGSGSRVFGRIRVRGRPANIQFGKAVYVLGDLTIVTSDGHAPAQIRIGDGVVLEHNATLFSLGGDILIEDGAFVGPGVIIQANGDIRIGRHCMLASNAAVYANNHRTDLPDVPYARQGNRFIGVVLEDNCWIGAGVTVLDGAHLGAGSVVGANCVVRGEYQPKSRVVAEGVLGVGRSQAAANALPSSTQYAEDVTN